MHRKEIREITINGTGIHIGRAFRNVSSILSRRVVHATSDELGRPDEMFPEEHQSDGRPS